MRTYVYCCVAGFHVRARGLRYRRMIKDRAAVNLPSDVTRFFQPISELAPTGKELAVQRLCSRLHQMSSGDERVCIRTRETPRKTRLRNSEAKLYRYHVENATEVFFGNSRRFCNEKGDVIKH